MFTGLAFGGGLMGGSALVQEAAARSGEGYTGLDTLARALHTIQTRHVDELSTEELVQDAITGMADARDRHTRYLDAETWTAMQARTEGEVEGDIGLRLMVGEQDELLVDRVVPGGPADLGGLREGDTLVLNEEMSALPPAQVLAQLESGFVGEPGSAVVIKVVRDGEALALTAVRDLVREPGAEVDWLAPGIAHARIVHFQREAGTDLRRGLQKLEEEQPLTGVVLDVRDNGGGLLEEAVAILDLFVDEGELVRVDGRLEAEREVFDATPGAPWVDLPLLVLVDGGTASASEIVAGSLQAMGRAELVGTDSYGKGSVQRIYAFEDGSALKLTVARYSLPGGLLIEDGDGLQPEHRVLRAAPADSPLGELQAKVSLLPTEQRAELEPLVAALSTSGDPDQVSVPWRGPPNGRLQHDPQLARGLALLTASP